MNSVYIETTNVCNLHCSFCPSGQAAGNPSQDFRREFMARDVFARCISEADRNVENVYFHVLGEPTLHPNFTDYLETLEQTKLKLNLTTNGTTIKQIGGKLLESKALRQINFSTHAYAELSQENATGHLKNVLEFCKQAQELRPDLYINLRLWNVGDESSSSWNDYLLNEINRTFGTDVTLGHFCSRHKSYLVSGRLYLHQDSRFEWPKQEPGSRFEVREIQRESNLNIPQGTCRALDTHVAILHDGRVVACCLDYSGQITLGNIKDQSLSEILNSPETTFLREGFVAHELRHPFCQRCTFCKRFK